MPRLATSRRFSQWLLISCLSVVGCEDAASQLDADAFRRAERDARCDYLVRCGFAPSVSVCRASFSQDRDILQAMGSVPFGRTEYDPAAAQGYIDLLSERGCEDLPELTAELADARRAIFRGLVDEGDACWTTAECSGENAICDTLACQGVGQLCCHGTCRSFRTLSIGATCPLDADEARFEGCSAEAYCSPLERDDGEPPTEGVCAPRSDNGQPCTAVEGCQDGQRCNTGGSGLCYVLSEDGEMCNPGLANGSCLRIDQLCDPGTSRCVAAPGPGEPCVNGRCQAHAVCREDMCVARLQAGEWCQDIDIPCLGDLRCQDSTCQRNSVALVCISGEPPPEPEPEPDGG